LGTEIQLSIVIPTYNRYERAVRAVGALSDQILADGLANAVEVIVVDDGSEAVCAAQLRAFVLRQQHPFLRLIELPRNQGASLTAWELLNHGVPHTVITDNAGGHLMQHGLVDMVITGADRVTRTGDAANKIGTYLKAVAAKDNNIPFYVALPSSTFDWNISDGIKQIPIEQRDPDEIKYIYGLADGKIQKVLITPKESNACNVGFDVTPSRLITGLITERGICNANEDAILNLFPEHKK